MGLGTRLGGYYYRENLSKLLMQLDAVNDDIESLAATLEVNVSQILMQLDVFNDDVEWVATTTGKNISKLFIQLDAVNDYTKLVAATIEIKIFLLFIQLDAVQRLAIIEQAEITKRYCGDGVWYRVAYMNMSNPSQQCPSAWREYNTGEFRVCGRPNSTILLEVVLPSFSLVILYIDSKVCGRVIAIQVGTPNAFYTNQEINDTYLDGVSITNGSPRKHIWSYVGSLYQNGCQCDVQPPSFVGNNYYCETSRPTNHSEIEHEFSGSGEQCNHEGTCCTGTNTPPWLSVSLPSPTNDDLEVRICGDQSTDNEDTPIELLEIFVQ